MSDTAQKNRRLIRWLVVAVIVMFGFAFALIPLYNVMCKNLGINGKPVLDPRIAAIAVQGMAAEQHDRIVTVEFLTTMNESLTWEFHPLHKKADMHPGGTFHTAYYAKNLTDHEMTIQAIPSITPGQAAKYIQKMECFCFTKQTLGAHQSAELPLVFVLDPEIPDDVHTLTLSYTLFDLTEQK